MDNENICEIEIIKLRTICSNGIMQSRNPAIHRIISILYNVPKEQLPPWLMQAIPNYNYNSEYIMSLLLTYICQRKIKIDFTDIFSRKDVTYESALVEMIREMHKDKKLLPKTIHFSSQEKNNNRNYITYRELIEILCSPSFSIHNRIALSADIYNSMDDDCYLCCNTLMSIKYTSQLLGWPFINKTARLVSINESDLVSVMKMLTGFTPSGLVEIKKKLMDGSRLKSKKYYDLDSQSNILKTTVINKRIPHSCDIKMCGSNEQQLIFLRNLYTRESNSSEPISLSTENETESDEREEIVITKSLSQPTPPKKQKRKTIPKSVRDAVWVKHNGRSLDGKCFVCKTKITTDGSGWHASHIVADSKGGLPTEDNLVPCCATCNIGMGNRDLREYLKSHYPKHSFIKDTKK